MVYRLPLVTLGTSALAIWPTTYALECVPQARRPTPLRWTAALESQENEEEEEQSEFST